MNILFATDDDLLTSVVYDIHTLSEGLSRQGHDVFVLDFDRVREAGKTRSNTTLCRVFGDSNAKLVRIPYVQISKVGVGLGFFQSLFAIRRVVKEKQIDVIVLYSVCMTGLPAIIVSRMSGIPLIFRSIDMLHRLAPTAFVGSILNVLERCVYKGAGSFWALSPKYREYLVEHGARPETVHQLPFPVDTSAFSQEVEGREEYYFDADDGNSNLIVFVGVLYAFNGLLDFVRNFDHVTRQAPDAKLLIVGDGVLRGELEELISSAGLGDSVRITGMQPFERLPQIINKAAICLNVYPVDGEMRDLFCAKVIQYLACGKPTVSSAVPGMVTMLPGEECGVVYVKDGESAAREVGALLTSAERRERLGRQGREYVELVHECRHVIQRADLLLKTSLATCAK
ncbi:glycosyltransferase [Maridesulfovibrio zosterae]|uniref:glycosyltransferase n=1 Tax=Maridesulfovibrio zosterae TaxID=82171 RepID=UPI0004021FE8|nr:glycosyltransferase [Maridesulfovibrio zosterae]